MLSAFLSKIKMGCSFFAIPLLVLLISTTSHLIFFNVQGRRLAPTPNNSKDSKILWRAQIGSRPPRCERRCGSCARCQAIQVPTNSQISGGVHNSAAFAAAARDESSSNYKPMSWKCKCGNLIFNP